MKKEIIIISSIILLLDQLIKLLVDKYLHIRTIIPNVFSLYYVKNEGISFSMLNGNRFIIIVISVLLMGFLIYILKRDYIDKNKNNILSVMSFGLLFGGIFGNFIDRLVRGYVIDYLAFFSFPVFNLADSCIVIGVIIMFIEMFIYSKKEVN